MNTVVRVGFVAAVILVNCVIAKADEAGQLAVPESGSQAVDVLNGTENNSDNPASFGRFSTAPNQIDFTRRYSLEDYVGSSEPTLQESFDTMVSSFGEFMGSLFRIISTKHVIGSVILIGIVLNAIFRK